MNKLPAEDVTYLACIWEKLHTDRDIVLSQRYVEITVLRVFKQATGSAIIKSKLGIPKISRNIGCLKKFSLNTR